MPATLKDIAQKANVTPRVVSAVVNNDFSRIRVGKEKRERIRQLIEELHYTPNQLARNLARQETRLVNLVISSARFFETTPNARFASGLQEYLLTQDYNLHFTVLKSGLSTPSSLITCPTADAVIMFYFGGVHSDALVETYRAFDLPLLTVRGRCEIPGTANLYNDEEDAMYRLVKELAEMGHTRITHVASYGQDIIHQDGMRGINRAVEEVGIGGFSSLVPEFRRDDPDSAGRAASIGQNGLRMALAQDPRPTVILFNHDIAALAAIDLARSMGLDVPGDLSICGSGNDPVGRVFQNPSLTTTEGKARQSGARAGELILRMIKDKTFVPREKVTIGPIFRKSVRKI